MRLSTKGRYAVMAMADLAGNAADAQAPGDPRPVALADIVARPGAVRGLEEWATAAGLKKPRR